ncbi:recombinase family protein [Paenibacillus ginsengihumi]|uniref:recombinase family protein n=1 Tax=Paenibacillus ginsengihumi TaxID=431596 RepID=UPI00037867BB|nr:recombinase family protein [Paenibacillus ginsengihumi]
MLKADYLSSLGIESIINYLRKSRADEEHERKTGEDVLRAQKELMDRFLDPLGIPFEQRLEVGSGDKIATRPVFQSVLQELQAGKYQAIAVKEISRMGRGSYTDMGIIYDLLVEKRIFVITPYKLYDPANSADLRQIRFELFMSREEFETTRERLFGGRVNNAMEGRWVAGAAPFGFVYNKTTKKLEINEDEAAVVRQIFDYYVNGVPDKNGKKRDVSFRALATYLKRYTPIRTPRGYREWRPIQLRQLITNERYIGTMRFRTTKRVGGKQVPRPEEEHIIVPDAVPAIIDRETWERAQAKVADSAHKPRTRMDFSPCELAGLCICMRCGRRMVRQYSVQHYRKQNGEVNVYHKEFLWCTTAGCTFVKYRSIEEDLLELLRHFRDLDADRLEEQISAILAAEKAPQSHDDMTEYIDQRERELKARMRFIYEKYETGIYTDEMFIERKTEIDVELKQLEEMKARAETAANEEQKAEIDTQAVKKNLTSILDAYNAADDKSDRNRILRAVFDHIHVELIERGRGRIPAKYVLYPVLKKDLTRSGFLVL